MKVQMPSPVGALLLTATDAGLTGLQFATGRHRPRDVAVAAESARAGEILQQAQTELEEYFSGGRTRFDLPLELQGTPFQVQVWNALRAIPYGTTVSYGWLARRLGRPTAVRAVGAANGRNPVAIIVPCHRVIGADGSLTGYGGGMERKQWLLRHERGSPELPLGP